MLLRVVLLPLVMLLMLGGKLEVQKMLLEVELLVLLMIFIVELLLLVMLLKGKLLLLGRVGRTVKLKKVERPTNSQHSSNNKSTRCRVSKLLCLQT